MIGSRVPTIERIVEHIRSRLEDGGFDTPVLDARLIAAHALGVTKEHILAHASDPIPQDAIERIHGLAERRLGEEPMAYIRGIKEFWSLDMEVGPGVLIPRPDTEVLVQTCIDHLRSRAQLYRDDRAVVADVGTGSGAIAIALARELPWIRVVAMDASGDALAYAGRNAARHGVQDRIALVRGDLVSMIAGPLECMAANLPYVAHGEIAALARGVRDFEPREALDGGAERGLGLVRLLMEQAPARLCAGGLIALEVADDQADEVAAMLEAARVSWSGIEVVRDLGRFKRVVTARRTC